MNARRTPSPDKRLLDLAQKWQECYAAQQAAWKKVMRRGGKASEDAEKAASKLQRAGWRIFDRLMLMEPTTMAGLAALATVARIELADAHADQRGKVEFHDPDVRGAYHVLRQVERLAERSV